MRCPLIRRERGGRRMPRWIVPLGTASLIAAGLVLRRRLTKPVLPQEAGQPARSQFRASPKTQEATRVLAAHSSALTALTTNRPEKHGPWVFRAGKATIHGLSAFWTKINNDW